MHTLSAARGFACLLLSKSASSSVAIVSVGKESVERRRHLRTGR